jgi:NitT/TauT family transport system ATP-binding protein
VSFLTLEAIDKTFPGPRGGAPVCALNQLSLTVEEGEYVSLLGRSGCGKSTLLAIVAGLEKPDRGQIRCRGQVVAGPERHRLLMFQDAALFPWLDVLANVLYGLNLVENLTNAERLSRAEKFLEMVGLADCRRFRVHQLSGGMRQRVALARALAPDPDLLLMDEPFSALDALTREQLYADLQRIWTETKKTILMVTHNVREAVCLGSRVVILASPGQVVADERVTLPYPRTLNDLKLTAVAAHISCFLQTEVEP